MPQNLRDLFERALDDEPVPPPGDLARQAMDRGRGIRRRRGLLAAGTGVAVAGAAMVVLNVAMPAAGPPPEVSPAAVAMMTQREPTCTWQARRSATDVSIFLRADITDAQRAALQAALRADPVVQGLQYESRDAAYQKFKVLWRDSPDFVAAVDADSMPESFRFELARPSEYPAFAARLKSQAGVQDLVGGVCP